MWRRKIALIDETRAHSNPLPGGSAPYTSSTHFKTKHPESGLEAKNFDNHFSTYAQSLEPSVLKSAATRPNPPGLITLGTGRPSPEYYPWDSMILCGVKAHKGGDDKRSNPPVPISMTSSKGEERFDLGIALNYGFAAGSPQLIRFITEHIELIHDPPYKNWQSSLTCGTTSAIEMAFRIFCNFGDWIITEEYTYSGTLDCAKAQGLNVMSARMDDGGLIPEDLDQKLQNWDPIRGRKPFLLYMIPSGHNPTGITQTTERREKIYAVAQKHDLYIIEDDAYYFLQLGKPSDHNSIKKPTLPKLDEYVESLPTSYLSIDISGRVLRLDSTSKILAPGLRCGWMTCSAQIMKKFLSHIDVSTIAPSGASQVMLYKILDQEWGHVGFLHWLQHLSAQYSKRRDLIIEACQRELPTNICHWSIPKEGMFCWIQVDYSKHPHIPFKDSQDALQGLIDTTENRIYEEARINGVLVSKGSWFAALDAARPSDLCFRLTFAAAPEGDLENAIALLGKTLRREFEIPMTTTPYCAVSGPAKNGCSARFSQKSTSKSWR
jgi:aromatic amino acid aminotransferase I